MEEFEIRDGKDHLGNHVMEVIDAGLQGLRWFECSPTQSEIYNASIRSGGLKEKEALGFIETINKKAPEAGAKLYHDKSGDFYSIHIENVNAFAVALPGIKITPQRQGLGNRYKSTTTSSSSPVHR